MARLTPHGPIVLTRDQTRDNHAQAAFFSACRDNRVGNA